MVMKYGDEEDDGYDPDHDNVLLDLFVVPLFWESHYAHFDLGKNLFLIALGRSGACNNHNGPH